MTQPADDVSADRWTTLSTRVLAPNPGPMTLDGTNSYVVRAPRSPEVVIVDPGPLDPGHLSRLTSLGAVSLILLTHGHRDHSESIHRLADVTGAEVRAASPAWCVGGPPLTDGEVIVAAGTSLRVVSVPGHTADSLCFHLPEDRPTDGVEVSGSILTGDTILGRGTSVIAAADGSLRSYLDSLRRLRSFGSIMVLPGHGPRREDLAAVANDYLERRLERLHDVSAALGERSATATAVDEIIDIVYPHTPRELRRAVEATVRAQLEYLADFPDKQVGEAALK